MRDNEKFIKILEVIDPRYSKLNIMLIFVPLAVFFEISNNHGLAFIMSMLAIMPLAYLMGKATEEIFTTLSRNINPKNWRFGWTKYNRILHKCKS